LESVEVSHRDIYISRYVEKVSWAEWPGCMGGAIEIPYDLILTNIHC